MVRADAATNLISAEILCLVKRKEFIAPFKEKIGGAVVAVAPYTVSGYTAPWFPNSRLGTRSAKLRFAD
jgi:hypothetical protein